MAFAFTISFIAGCNRHVVNIPMAGVQPSPSPTKEATSIPPPPADLQELPSRITVTPTTPPSKQETQRYSISVSDADIKEVLMVLAKQSGVNIIAGEDVLGKVTVNFNNVSLAEALEAILATSGYTYLVDKNIIRIVQARTAVFKVDYISMINAQGLQGAGGVISTAGAGGGIGGGQGQGNFWAQIKSELQQILTEKGATTGKIVVNELSGIIMVSATQEKIDKVERYLKALEESLHRQVQIQARIVEVILDNDYRMGINWDIPAITLDGLHANTAARAKQTLSPGEGIFNFVITNDHLTAVLDAIASQGQTNTLSAPKILAMQNQIASIDITEQVPYYETSFTQIGETAQYNVEVNFKDAGVKLQVIPQISGKGEIMMLVIPEITSVVGYTKAVHDLEPVPILDRRQVMTFVRANDGETVVIGGLIRDKVFEVISEVPFLGRIPGLGALFRNTRQETKKTELVIMLTPQVITAEKAISIRRLDEQSVEKLQRALHFGAPAVFR